MVHIESLIGAAVAVVQPVSKVAEGASTGDGKVVDVKVAAEAASNSTQILTPDLQALPGAAAIHGQGVQAAGGAGILPIGLFGLGKDKVAGEGKALAGSNIQDGMLVHGEAAGGQISPEIKGGLAGIASPLNDDLTIAGDNGRPWRMAKKREAAELESCWARVRAVISPQACSGRNSATCMGSSANNAWKWAVSASCQPPAAFRCRQGVPHLQKPQRQHQGRSLG